MSLLTDLSQLNTSKYNRFFVIGCSFTEWHWPTWANLIAEEHPHLEFISFAKPGQGNTYISTMLNQLSYSHNLCETDLVGILWSTFHRRDYYTSLTGISPLKDIVKNVNQEVVTHNLHNWNMHGDSIHSQLHNNDVGFCDRGFLIRDLAIIDNTTKIIEQAPYTAFQMFSVEPEKQNSYDLTLSKHLQRNNDDVLSMYSHLNSKMASKTSLFKEMNYDFTVPTVTWIPSHIPEDSHQTENDYHPSSSIYCQFLQNNGYKVTQHTIDKCKLFDAKIQQTTRAMHLQDDDSWPYKTQSPNKPWPL